MYVAVSASLEVQWLAVVHDTLDMEGGKVFEDFIYPGLSRFSGSPGYPTGFHRTISNFRWAFRQTPPFSDNDRIAQLGRADARARGALLAREGPRSDGGAGVQSDGGDLEAPRRVGRRDAIGTQVGPTPTAARHVSDAALAGEGGARGDSDLARMRLGKLFTDSDSKVMYHGL